MCIRDRDTVPFRPNEDKLTLAVVAAFDTVALAGMIPHNMITAKTADIVLLTFFFTLLYLFSVFEMCIRDRHILCPTEHRLPRPTIFGNLNVRLVYLTR